MHEEVEQLRPKLKEILYDCAVEIKATKAALYLLDPAVRRFELVAEFGFRTAILQSATFNHPLVDRCERGRTPFYVNSVSADPKLSQMLFEASTERLLVAPLFSRGDLVGMIDMRDKAGKQPFSQADVPKAQTIAEKILEVFAAKNLFNQRFITLADVPQPAEASPPSPATQPTAPVRAQTAQAVRTAPVESSKPSAERFGRLSNIINIARQSAARIAMPPQPRGLSESEMRGIRDVLRGILYLPGAIVAALSMTGASGGIQEIAARGAISDDALNSLSGKLQAWLLKRGESTGPMKTSVQTPFGVAGKPISPEQLHKVYTAPVNAAAHRGLYLTVGFAETPERHIHELLAALLNQLQLAIEVSYSRETLEGTRSRAAAYLMEPQFTSYPELRKHSEAVAARSVAFAQYLDLGAADVETVTLTALVHDAGMRLLDYDTLYKKPKITDEELAILREHVSVGAAMVEPLLGTEVARAVLCHHERVDGGGYPNQLQGNEIPLASRIVQICDVYVTMTEPQSYQRQYSHADAVALITRGAGGQFDADLARKFAALGGGGNGGS